MGWTLELVQTDPLGERQKLRVTELGEVAAPSHIDEVGLGLTTAQRLLGELQQAIVAIQEAALRAKAVRMRADDPTLRLKDYRRRSLQTLFGAVCLRVPRLACVVPDREPSVVLVGSSRSSIEYDRLRARLGAWMSYRTAHGLLAKLFPLATGRHASTVQQHVLREADRLARRPATPSAEDPDVAATAIDLGLDTTFIRSCATDGPRHHEVLIGVGVNDRGQEAKIATTASSSATSTVEPAKSYCSGSMAHPCNGSVQHRRARLLCRRCKFPPGQRQGLTYPYRRSDQAMEQVPAADT